MDKKIGKFLLFLCWTSCLLADQQAVRMYTQDLEQNLLRQAEKGVPFVLQIVADNIQGAQRPSEIAGFKDFDVSEQGSTQSMTIVNGQKNQRITFNYVLKAHKAGVFKIGPVEIKDYANNVVTSEPLHVRVGDQVLTHAVKKQVYFLQVDIDKKTLFIGQELVLKIRFYYADEFQNLRIVKPDLEGFALDSISDKPVVGKEKVNGDEYSYQEWTVKVYPEKVGTLMIPPFQAAFMMPANFQQGLLGLFDVFSMSSERAVQASARSVDVKALPLSKEFHDVTAVGIFQQASFVLDKHKAEAGEGIVAKLKVVGHGNMQSFKAPLLELPDGLRYYESNSFVKKIDDENSEKIFEYILQGDRAGEFTIAPQTFNYFDIQDEKYKLLQTQGAQITIDGVAQVLNDFVEKKEDAKFINVLPVNNKYQFKENQIDFVYESGWFYEDVQGVVMYFLSWLLMVFGWLSLIAFLYWGYCLYIGVKIMDVYWVYYVVMRVQVLQLVRRDDVQGLYQLLYGMSQRYGFDMQSEDVIRYFKKSGKSDKDIEQWQIFLTSLMHVVFSQDKSQTKMKQYVVSHAAYWIRELLRYCRYVSNGSKVSVN